MNFLHLAHTPSFQFVYFPGRLRLNEQSEICMSPENAIHFPVSPVGRYEFCMANSKSFLKMKLCIQLRFFDGIF